MIQSPKKIAAIPVAPLQALLGRCLISRRQGSLTLHLVIPGRAPATRFAENGGSRMLGLDNEAYADLVKGFMAGFIVGLNAKRVLPRSNGVVRLVLLDECLSEAIPGFKKVRLELGRFSKIGDGLL